MKEEVDEEREEEEVRVVVEGVVMVGAVDVMVEEVEVERELVEGVEEVVVVG